MLRRGADGAGRRHCCGQAAGGRRPEAGRTTFQQGVFCRKCMGASGIRESALKAIGVIGASTGTACRETCGTRSGPARGGAPGAARSASQRPILFPQPRHFMLDNRKRVSRDYNCGCGGYRGACGPRMGAERGGSRIGSRMRWKCCGTGSHASWLGQTRSQLSLGSLRLQRDETAFVDIFSYATILKCCTNSGRDCRLKSVCKRYFKPKSAP